MLPRTRLADAVTELYSRAIADIFLNLLPDSIRPTYSLAKRADRQDPFEDLHPLLQRPPLLRYLGMAYMNQVDLDRYLEGLRKAGLK